MAIGEDRRVPSDWYDGAVPACVDVDRQAHLESAYSFAPCRSQQPGAIRIARGAHIYSSTLFDVGEMGSVTIGECAMLNGARLICESRIDIGAYAAISWNVVFMDSYQLPFDPHARRVCLQAAAQARTWPRWAASPSRPIRLHDNVWLGFEVCVLPGVTIGEGSVVGARSVVVHDVPAYTVVAGNPARVIRELPREPSEAVR